MLEKEITDVLVLEEELEAKYARAEKKAEKIHVDIMNVAQKKAVEIKQAADENLSLMKERFDEKLKVVSKQMQDKAAQTTEIIDACHQDLASLAEKTCHELISELRSK